MDPVTAIVAPLSRSASSEAPSRSGRRVGQLIHRLAVKRRHPFLDELRHIIKSRGRGIVPPTKGATRCSFTVFDQALKVSIIEATCADRFVTEICPRSVVAVAARLAAHLRKRPPKAEC